MGKVIGILGPTGVGKTAVAAHVAKLLGTRVISCDSMQLYRDFPVLTNQPTLAETGGVEHALVACLDPGTHCTAAAYAELARPLIAADLRERGAAVVAGGTGLYVRAALAPLAVAPRDDDLRCRLEQRLAERGLADLFEELVRRDPEAARAVDPNNPRRVVRALEAVLCGRHWSGRNDLWDPAYYHPTVIFALSLERDELYRRLEVRTRRMLETGAIEEVRRFHEAVGRERALPGGPGIRSAIGYREIWRYLEGEASFEDTVAQMTVATRRYVRRQVTWLRKVKGAVIIDLQRMEPEEAARKIVDLVWAGAAPRVT